MSDYRIEKDSMGEVRVPADAYWGAQTQRAVDNFPIDVFQTGSGTSTNMNANEVIANRASEILGGARGSKEVHPNDHVNACQSSNDVIPTAIHLSTLQALRDELQPALTMLAGALQAK